MLGAGGHLWDHVGKAPVLLIPRGARSVLPPSTALPPAIAKHYEHELAYTDRIRSARISPVRNIIRAGRGLSPALAGASYF
jgi:hypothetical protein